MAGPSKNSRAGRTTTQAKGGANTAIKALIPLGAGRFAYVFNAEDGTNTRLSVTSEEFVEAIRAKSEAGQAAKLRDELVALHQAQPTHGWDATLTRLEAAGALG